LRRQSSIEQLNIPAFTCICNPTAFCNRFCATLPSSCVEAMLYITVANVVAETEEKLPLATLPGHKTSKSSAINWLSNDDLNKSQPYHDQSVLSSLVMTLPLTLYLENFSAVPCRVSLQSF